MNRSETLQLLRKHVPELERNFGVQHLALFGSFARDTAGPNSDVDLLVTFAGAATLRRYMGVKLYLEPLLGAKVDLVTQQSLRPELRPYIEHELVNVA